jgi:hypothetical protein
MKKLFPIIFILFLGGCMRYVTPHGQNITLKNIEKLPVKVALFLPPTISQDSILVSMGEEILDVHTNLMIRLGGAMSDAIKKSVAASFNEIGIYDSLPDQGELVRNSFAFLITPEFLSKKATLWMSPSFPATFETELRLIITGKNQEIIDSIHIHAFGVQATKNNSLRKDTVVADAADSAIASMQDQIIYSLTRSNKIRSRLSLNNPSNNVQIITPQNHGLYGSSSQFLLDTNSFTLIPLPSSRRWSEWFAYGLNRFLDFYIAVDLLLDSKLSFRSGLSFTHYWENTEVFTGSSYTRNAGIYIVNWGVVVQASYLFFGPKFFLEAGIGLNTVIGTGFTGRINIPGVQRFQPMGILGIRHQPIMGGVSFSLAYTPYFVEDGYEDHLSIGYGFAF